jgi:hypothetical protein
MSASEPVTFPLIEIGRKVSFLDAPDPGWGVKVL